MSTTYGIQCWHLCATLKLVLGWRHSSKKLSWEELLSRAIFGWIFVVRQDIFPASCQQSRVSEELAASAPSACCDGKWRLGWPGRRTWTGEGKGGVQLATSSMNRQLMFVRAWSMTHAVKLSALSAVHWLFVYLCAPVFDIAHALVLVGCQHVLYSAFAIVVRVHARW